MNHQVFLTEGFDKDGNAIPLLIAYKSEGKSLTEFDFRAFGDYTDSIVDDVFTAIKNREYGIDLMPGKQVNITFNA